MIIFVIGGTRSGKSSFALKEASKLEGRKAYIATAEPLDAEMKERIEKHKVERGPEWTTFEAAMDIVPILNGHRHDVVIIDCLTLWLSNIMLGGEDVNRGIDGLIKAIKEFNGTIYIVSNEVGMGIVPDNEAARRFRDLAGMLNQKVAEIADEVYLTVAGIPVKIKNQ